MAKWLGAQSLLLFLAPHQVGFFFRCIPNGIYSNKAQSTWKNQAFSGGVSLLCNLVWFSRTFGECFSSEFMYIVLVTQIDSKNIRRMSSRIRPDRRIVLTPQERAWYYMYSALYLNKFHLVWIKIFWKIPPYAELKIVTNSVYLVIWSPGFPTLMNTGIYMELFKV